MNRRIILSLLTITAAMSIVAAGTIAQFSDQETNDNNTITAGSIDISVDDRNPWTNEYPVVIDDMKPSYVRWSKHVVKNVGTNPLRLWKRIDNIQTSNNGWSEPECSDANGTWQANPSPTPGGTCTGDPTEQNNIDEYIEYDMYTGGDVIDGGDENNNWLGGHNSGGQVIIDENDGITLRDIQSVYIYLGELAPNDNATGGEDEITVWQSYHMTMDAGNWAQTDQLTYTIEFYAEQVNGPGPISHSLLLENKDTAGDWSPVIGDGTWGILKWAGDGETFSYDLKARGLTTNTNYNLIYYADPWPGNNPGALLGSGTSDTNGSLTITGNPDLGMDLPAPADANYPDGAKIWLVPASDYNGGSASTGPMTTWNPGDILYEYNLITYDDTGA